VTLKRIVRFFRIGPRSSRDVTAEIDDEIRSHLAYREDQLRRSGLTAADAHAEALRLFGSIDEAREEIRRSITTREERMREREMLSGLVQDVRYAARGLRRDWRLTVFTTLTLTFGVGLNAVLFGVLDRLLLRGPSHVRETEQVSRLYMNVRPPGLPGRRYNGASYPLYSLLSKRLESLGRVAAYNIERTSVLGHGASARVINLGESTHDFFPLLGVSAAVGRFYGPDEDDPGHPRNVVVLGHGLWTGEFGSDPRIIGRTISLNDQPYVVVGVAPRGFNGADLKRVDAWVPMSAIRALSGPSWKSDWEGAMTSVLVRRRPGVSPEAVAAAATQAFKPAYAGPNKVVAAASIGAAPLNTDMNGDPVPEALVARWLSALGIILLALACANLTNLLLARAILRRREMAVRTALGAPRRRLGQLLAAEAFFIAATGCTAGVLAAFALGKVVVSTLLPQIDWSVALIDGRVLVFAGVVCFALTLAF
jgi:hypothetical protein